MTYATVHIKNGKIKKIEISRKPVKFKCQKCAIVCCGLGAPELTEKDMKRLIKKWGEKKLASHLEEREKRSHYNVLPYGFKSKEKGKNPSCIFLKNSECTIYNDRPILCRLFPFHLEKEKGSKGEGIITVGLIPCLGINSKKGEAIDKNYIKKLINNYGFLLK